MGGSGELRMLKRIFLLSLAATTVSGCGEYLARQSYQYARQAEVNDDAKCRSYGAEPGSQAYMQCRMNLDNNRAAIAQAAVGAYFANGGVGGRPR
jgi:hypothetical protein